MRAEPCIRTHRTPAVRLLHTRRISRVSSRLSALIIVILFRLPTPCTSTSDMDSLAPARGRSTFHSLIATQPDLNSLSWSILFQLFRVLKFLLSHSSRTVSFFRRICCCLLGCPTNHAGHPFLSARERRPSREFRHIHPSIDNRIVSILLYSTTSFRSGRPPATFHAGFLSSEPAALKIACRMSTIASTTKKTSRLLIHVMDSSAFRPPPR